MGRMEEDFAVLRENVDAVEAGLIKSLLDAEGIPSLAQGADFDVAELGVAAHQTLRGTTVYVPPSALERAKEILTAAWGQETEEG